MRAPDPFRLLIPRPRVVRRLSGEIPAGVMSPEPEVVRDAGLPSGGYRLRLEGDAVRISCADDPGERHARATLEQIRRLPPQTLPAVEIEDAPALRRRGVMLDVSRCRVPTMPQFRGIIDALAGLKADHLQCYTEHAFAYRGHETVWTGRDPITPDEARALDACCLARGVELAANQNCFGHLARWLRTPGYEHLAETHGDWVFAGMPRSGPFSLCPIDPRAMPFIESLLDELLPCFASPLVNIGCDETYDIGQGRSRSMVEREGKAAVYGDFVAGVCRAVLSRGRTPMFWGDIAGAHPAVLDLLPPEAIGVPWGYEPSHDFAREGAAFRERGMRWWACCGSSSWRSFAGRPAERRGNIRRCAHEAAAGGADGMLIADWGDLGHRQVWPVALLGITEGLDAAWTGAARSPAFLEAASLQVFGDRSLAIAGWLEELGDADEPLRAVSGRPGPGGERTRLINASALFTELHPPPVRLALPPRAEPWLEARARIASLADRVPAGGGPLVERELTHAVQCSLWACDVALARRGGSVDPGRLEARRAAIKAEQRSLWEARSRIGGLDESLAFWDDVPMEHGR